MDSTVVVVIVEGLVVIAEIPVQLTRNVWYKICLPEIK